MRLRHWKSLGARSSRPSQIYRMRLRWHKNTSDVLKDVAEEDYCYLTTTGRVTGNPHGIEIWFGARGNSIYLLSGNGRGSDWVKNLLKNPQVTVRILKTTFCGYPRAWLPIRRRKWQPAICWPRNTRNMKRNGPSAAGPGRRWLWALI